MPADHLFTRRAGRRRRYRSRNRRSRRLRRISDGSGRCGIAADADEFLALFNLNLGDARFFDNLNQFFIF